MTNKRKKAESTRFSHSFRHTAVHVRFKSCLKTIVQLAGAVREFWKHHCIAPIKVFFPQFSHKLLTHLRTSQWTIDESGRLFLVELFLALPTGIAVVARVVRFRIEHWSFVSVLFLVLPDWLKNIVAGILIILLRTGWDAAVGANVLAKGSFNNCISCELSARWNHHFSYEVRLFDKLKVRVVCQFDTFIWGIV